MHVSMGIFRLFMQGKLNAYLLWPLGKSVIINKHRSYVYSEHKRILLRTQIQYILRKKQNHCILCLLLQYWNLYNRLHLIPYYHGRARRTHGLALCAFSIEFQGSPISEEFAPLSDLQTPDSKRKKMRGKTWTNSNDGEICADPNNIQTQVFETHISTEKQFIYLP